MPAQLRDRLADCDWSGEAIEQLIAEICEQKGIGMGKAAHADPNSRNAATFS